ncbi:MAG: hypothetical protein Q9170_005909 [Blastenia crenularia]
MRAAKSDPPQWVYDNLPHNGWNIQEGDAGALGEQAKKAMESLNIPLDPSENLVLTAGLTNRFINYQQNLKIKAASIVHLCFPSDSLGGTYSNMYNVNGHAIVALSNYSPSYRAKQALDTDEQSLEGDALRAVVPNFNRWSDVVWAIWNEVAGEYTGDLRYILRNSINTLSTQYLIELIEGSLKNDQVSMSLELRWPGHTYNMMDERGLALLGSSHGVGISWLYVTGRKYLGLRDQLTVTVFTGRPNIPSRTDEYYLLWDLGPPPRRPPPQ